MRNMPHPKCYKGYKPKTQSEYKQKKQWTSKTTILSTIAAKKNAI